jgi:hypothetical protein
VWDFNGTGGANAVYVDAYDKVNCEWIYDDFVTIDPDDDSLSLTRSVNDIGQLMTDNITEEQITSKNPTGDYPEQQWEFLYWHPESGVSADRDVPEAPGATIKVFPGDVFKATAMYVPTKGAEPLRVQLDRPFTILIGNLADNPYILITPGRPPQPQPGGGWDPTALGLL